MDFIGITIAMGVISGLIALTAIGGGLAILFGAEANRFPLEWLEGTTFYDYTQPAHLLAIAVGGSSCAAWVMVVTNRKFGMLVSMAAVLFLIGYFVVEGLILKQVSPGLTMTGGYVFWAWPDYFCAGCNHPHRSASPSMPSPLKVEGNEDGMLVCRICILYGYNGVKKNNDEN
jgi:hypothetical protein